jgi:malic enzyme
VHVSACPPARLPACLQGTAATAVAGLYGAMAVAGKPPSEVLLQLPACLALPTYLAHLLPALPCCEAATIAPLRSPLPTLPCLCPAALADQRFVVLGAGSAGMGVVSMIAASESGRWPACLPACIAQQETASASAHCMPSPRAAHSVQLPRPAHPPSTAIPAPACPAGMVKQGLSPSEAAARFYVLDQNGLITHQARPYLIWCSNWLAELC